MENDSVLDLGRLTKWNPFPVISFLISIVFSPQIILGSMEPFSLSFKRTKLLLAIFNRISTGKN